MSHNAVLIGIELFASSVWIGSFVCLVVVTSVARSSLAPTDQITFFRSLGRRYGSVGNVALAATLAAGLALLWPPSAWGGLQDAAVALAGLVVVATVLGIRQARAMGRLRRRHLANPEDRALALRVERGARNARLLRALIGLASLAALSVIAVLLGR